MKSIIKRFITGKAESSEQKNSSTIKKEIEKYMTWREFNFNTNISLKNKYVYFELAKAACSTIKKRLLNFEISPFDGSNIKLHHDIFSSPFVKPYQLDSTTLNHILFSDEYFKFSFVRLPYSRILSAYLEKIVRRMPQTKQVLQTLDIKYDESSFRQIRITFEQFIESIEKTSPRKLDKHWRPQHLLLMHPLVELNFVGKIESFESDWESIISSIGLKNDSGENILWHQTGARNKLEQYYTKQLSEQVTNLYSLDFATYNYDKNC